jgi:hypothetical protein
MVAICREFRDKLAAGQNLHAYGYIASVSARTNVPDSTCSLWRDRIEAAEGFPWDDHFGNRRLFEHEEEVAIAEYVRFNYIRPGFVMTDIDFKDIAYDAYMMKWHQLQMTLPQSDLDKWVKDHPFTCSDGFVSDFKIRNGFSSRRCHLKRRSTVSEQVRQQFVDEIEWLFRNVPRDHILNCDETSWRVFPNGLLTWADTGSQNVQAIIDGSEKDCITVLATARATGGKCPLFFLAHGVTQAVEESQLPDVGYHWKDHSPSGWQTSETFSRYLDHLRRHLSDEFGEVHLLLDLHSSHNNDNTKSWARNLNFILHFIPAGMTDKHQPLDIGVFGPLKAKARAFFRERKAADGQIQTQLTKREAAIDIMRAWTTLSNDVIAASWSQYAPWDEEQED